MPKSVVLFTDFGGSDYDDLSEVQKGTLRVLEAEIDNLGRQSKEIAFETGKKLTLAKSILRERFVSWRRTRWPNFQDKTATRYMNFASVFGTIDAVPPALGLTSLCDLAEKGVSASVRSRVVEESLGGRAFSTIDIKRIIASAKWMGEPFLSKKSIDEILCNDESFIEAAVGILVPIVSDGHRAELDFCLQIADPTRFVVSLRRQLKAGTSIRAIEPA